MGSVSRQLRDLIAQAVAGNAEMGELVSVTRRLNSIVMAHEFVHIAAVLTRQLAEFRNVTPEQAWADVATAIALDYIEAHESGFDDDSPPNGEIP